MKFIDIHAHLESSQFKRDLKKIIEQAKKVGVVTIINSGVNPETNRETLKLSKEYSIIKCSFGIYPIDAIVKEIESSEKDFLRKIKPFDVDEELNWIEEHKNDCVAIGEVGLDYNSPEFTKHKEKQIKVFEKAITLAKKINKPLIIHSRKAELDAITILEKHQCKKVVMHCFSGKKSLIKRCVENGWFLSVPPVITRLEHFKMLVEIVPLKQLLTETDAPYLSPVAGTRNEPANIPITIKEIAKIKNIDEEKIAEQIFSNTKDLFNL
ncbi:TatD family hydrolase [Candidatus Pacearchaeota archaeon]|nr:TatD family hydrolase [Candidatus Pacearchaeota archaeon]